MKLSSNTFVLALSVGLCLTANNVAGAVLSSKSLDANASDVALARCENPHRLHIYFIRHGDTDWTDQRRIQGTSDVLLNDRGVKYAEHVGKWLSDVPIAFAYASPFQRAYKTLDIIKEHHKTRILSSMDWRLIGRGMGVLTGKSYDEVDWTKPGSIDGQPGVEPQAGHDRRLQEVLGGVIGYQVVQARRHPEGYDANVMIIGHGATFVPMIRSLRKAAGESEESLDRTLPPYFAIGTIPIVTIEGLEDIPLKGGLVDLEATQSHPMAVQTSYEHILPPKEEPANSSE